MCNQPTWFAAAKVLVFLLDAILPTTFLLIITINANMHFPKYNMTLELTFPKCKLFNGLTFA